MSLSKMTAAAAFAAAAMGVFAASDANALPRCRAPIEGYASATGIFGAGSAKARVEARRDWEYKARNLYGPRYANFWNARDKQYDCKKNAILLAKCVVVAAPCRY